METSPLNNSYASESNACMNDSNIKSAFPTKAFVTTLVVNTIWINVSEVFRYFVFVMPMMRTALSSVENVAPMNVGVFAIWGLWDTILVLTATLFVWLFLERFGYGRRNAMLAGGLFWMAVFVILWLGLLNMNLATPKILGVALPLALVEIVVAAIIVDWGMRPTPQQTHNHAVNRSGEVGRF
ncbi:hypothetical protein [Leptothoe sp. PORK10 BA2]|uniref:hypothetical protein n=1 Tax=Leptothoe sp. PORK10 BA2 TaxID=3110254 RepID=UPI002B1EC752|nr:hypothetical protein [Leptothoe sp. PORK10 BA2]MEA5464265.1 hypothetical protein [Leptothoe sp. PORK10 BA2]